MRTISLVVTLTGCVRYVHCMAEPLRGGGLGFPRFCGRHGFARSLLPKGPRDLIPKWFEQVLERGALVGLNESLDWHARNEAGNQPPAENQTDGSP